MNPLASIPGVLTIAAWSTYLVLAILHSFDVPPWVLITIAFGVLACIAIAVGYRHWRVAVLAASSIYLVLYALRVLQMAASVTNLEKESLLSALSFYYATSWRLTSLTFRDRGIFDGSAHAFLEYLMPVLMVSLIGATLVSWYRGRALLKTG
jgi:hypothetical protein